MCHVAIIEMEAGLYEASKHEKRNRKKEPFRAFFQGLCVLHVLLHKQTTDILKKCEGVNSRPTYVNVYGL